MNDHLKTWEEAVLWLKHQPGHKALVKACFFDDPLLAAAERYYNSAEWKAVRQYLSENRGMALDIGAGRGISSYALSRDGWNVDALEPDPSEIVGAGAIRKLNNEANLNIHVVEEFGERLPYKDGLFDVVYCRQVLHHANSLFQLCQEIGRVLRTGGCFIAAREHVISKKQDLNLFFENHSLHHMYGGENAYLLGEYKSAIRAGGIKIDYILNPFASDINLFPETIFSKKKQIASKVGLPFPELIPDKIIHWLGNLIQTPGRPYSFVGHKR